MRRARSAQSRLASPSSESQSSSSEAGTHLTAFSQISAHASGAWRHQNILVPISIWDFYFDISEWYILSTRAWTPALMLRLTNLCAKRNVRCLTKPKARYIKRNPSAIILQKHIGSIKIEVVIRLKNMLKKCIIKISYSDVSFMFVQTFVNVPGRFANIF